MNRGEFLKGGLAALGFMALDGLPVFAAPAGWQLKKKPNLVFGILSDTHLQSGWDGVTPHKRFPHTYVMNAMKLFCERDIDAFMHLGDAAHRGKNVEVQYHRDIFEKFFPNGKARDGRTVEKLVVVGNHELYGNVAKGGGAWAPNIWKDPEERAKHVLCGDLRKHWEQVWGEKFEAVWHKEVKGYHFFGRHWNTKEMKLANFINAKAEEYSLKGNKPFFILSHRCNRQECINALREFPNAISFSGHWHHSNADGKMIYFDSIGGIFPNIQVGACRMDGTNVLSPPDEIKIQEDPSSFKGPNLPSRQAMIVDVYDDMVVFERHEVGEGGKLGPDWVLPLNWGTGRHPFSREELKKAIGAPEFGKNAKLVVTVENPDTPLLRVTIPIADGNPDSLPYAYNVVVAGDDPKARYFKSEYFSGVNSGVGHEPNNGVTTVDMPLSELPVGKKLTIAVRPVSSLGAKGKSIGTTWTNT